MSRSRKTNRDHAKKKQRPMIEDEVIATQLEQLLTPAITAQENYYRQLKLRDRILNLPSVDAAFGKQRDILEYVAKRRDVFVGRVDHRGTSQVCPNCRAEVRKDLSVRLSECHECGYVVDRDIASGQEICNRGEETDRGTREKQEIGSQVVLSGNFVVDKWRNLSSGRVGEQDSIGDSGSPLSIR